MDHIFFVDTTGGPVTATLPSPVVAGQRMTFKDSKGNFNANALTLAPQGAILIEGFNGNYVVAAQWAHIVVECDGTNYFI